MVLIRVPARTTGGAAGGGQGFAGCKQTTAFPSNTTFFFQFNGVNNGGTTVEANQQITCPALTLVRLVMDCFSNTKDTDYLWDFRDDGVTVATLNVGQTTGQKDSGVLAVAIAAGSLVGFRGDINAATSGSIGWRLAGSWF